MYEDRDIEMSCLKRLNKRQNFRFPNEHDEVRILDSEVQIALPSQ